MRILYALKADVKFQFKQGFYTVYVLLTIMYMVILSPLSREIKEILVPLVVFSDPSMVGFFFIGAISMLERVQGVMQYLAITPLRSREYLLSKVISLTLLALTAGTLITLLIYEGPVNWPLLYVGILLSSSFFTLYGFKASASSHTMNQYFLNMIPYLLLVVLPCFSLLDFPYSWIFTPFPSVVGLKLVFGAFENLSLITGLLYTLYLLLLNVLLLLHVERVFQKMVIEEGSS